MAETLTCKDGWRSIATIPKDGRKVMLYRPLAGESCDPVVTIRRTTKTSQHCWPDTIPPGCDGQNFTEGSCYATHWMPLPEPPAQGMEALVAETEGLGSKTDSPVAEGHAPDLSAALARVERLEKALGDAAADFDNIANSADPFDDAVGTQDHGLLLAVEKMAGAAGEKVRSALSEAPPQGEQ